MLYMFFPPSLEGGKSYKFSPLYMEGEIELMGKLWILFALASHFSALIGYVHLVILLRENLEEIGSSGEGLR